MTMTSPPTPVPTTDDAIGLLRERVARLEVVCSTLTDEVRRIEGRLWMVALASAGGGALGSAVVGSLFGGAS